MVAYNSTALAPKPRILSRQEITSLLAGEGPTLTVATIMQWKTALDTGQSITVDQLNQQLDFIPTRPK
jgi:hypothetical protein